MAWFQIGFDGRKKAVGIIVCDKKRTIDDAGLLLFWRCTDINQEDVCI
jgi:hypothetical protein